MSKIALKMVEEMQLSWEYGQRFHPYSIIWNGRWEDILNINMYLWTSIFEKAELLAPQWKLLIVNSNRKWWFYTYKSDVINLVLSHSHRPLPSPSHTIYISSWNFYAVVPIMSYYWCIRSDFIRKKNKFRFSSSKLCRC